MRTILGRRRPADCAEVGGCTGAIRSTGRLPLSNVAGCNVDRDAATADAARVTATSFVDSGPAAATPYARSVAAVGGTGLEGTRSAAVGAPATGSAATCCTASNPAHVGAGHAHRRGGCAHANGSNRAMGFRNGLFTTTLKQTGMNHDAIGRCAWARRSMASSRRRREGDWFSDDSQAGRIEPRRAGRAEGSGLGWALRSARTPVRLRPPVGRRAAVGMLRLRRVAVSTAS